MAKYQADEREPRLTVGEKTQVALLVVRMAKRGLADDRQYGGRIDQGDLEKKVERIIERARLREERDGRSGRRK
ncbi:MULTISPECIES: DUF6257 family protein [Streptomyces]|uniref:Uncharacterized protein n=1 Tax=Streptomyces tsukubensis (strain DSM 42081 / NBRC 108919 / NRRL 18488 / 9993) TaxID=1114943 RepID=I2N0W5_STRT9|nr:MULTISPECIES: DUF6257 family protein [Streptomyces]AZK94853.1 hypothetical protein B7R87_13985 [Streptomyces tsukubensis]EIF90662.1 hypothetical protein [Streptomyces tsukubensis NRRL18488]MYS66977.1 hypothetical protein [Streptomyces sp. SID5473]QKM69065.1 hypothetical protein STSU_019785 [Streptomyces tsukubensis NRRL18488]TAI40713.1 hypothetical protein EWI31_30450 [Streptomyces tsukubensis]